MKKLLLLIISIIFISCSSDDNSGEVPPNKQDGIKLVKTSRGGSVTTIEYNENGYVSRFVEDHNNGEEIIISNFNYSNGKLTSIAYNKSITNFIYEGDLIAYSILNNPDYEIKNVYEYNSKNQVVKNTQYTNNNLCCYTTYTYYSNGNIKKATSFSDDRETSFYYTYDDEKSVAILGIYPDAYLKISEISKNNILTSSYNQDHSNPYTTYSYEYNEYDLPIKMTEDRYGDKYITIYEYEINNW